MPKQKTRKSAAKRFPKAGRSNPTRRKAGSSHLLTKKTGKRKRSLRKAAPISESNIKAIRRMVPYN